jgi:anaerobic selenocysteine-containing dehydrogenase
MKLHRGQPVAFINPEVARDKGIEDGDMMRVFNDVDETEIMASLSAAVGPGQILVYMWEPYQFKDWKSLDALLAAVPKPTHFALEYTQLKYYFLAGSPTPTGDRALRVDFEKV